MSRNSFSSVLAALVISFFFTPAQASETNEELALFQQPSENQHFSDFCNTDEEDCVRDNDEDGYPDNQDNPDSVDEDIPEDSDDSGY